MHLLCITCPEQVVKGSEWCAVRGWPLSTERASTGVSSWASGCGNDGAALPAGPLAREERQEAAPGGCVWGGRWAAGEWMSSWLRWLLPEAAGSQGRQDLLLYGGAGVGWLAQEQKWQVGVGGLWC